VFRWFCRGTAREDVEQTIVDIQRDCQQMRAEGHRLSFIRRVVVWQSFMVVVQVGWRGVRAIATVWSPESKTPKKRKPE
jgi:hypothetical protein